MLTIDGSYNEGGGQILRTALTLSLATRTPFRIEKIRAGRKRPGLLRQHLTAVLAATRIGNAEVRGAEINSTELTFAPQDVVPGDYQFSIGTAGSTMLVLQTVLPVLMLADRPTTLTLEGGTHNPAAPPYHFVERVY
ncbi:MAG: RNA 3'-terminal phosphate cyclase, partial [Gammaproteobacteria bacterium]